MREIPIDFKSIALTTRPRMLLDNNLTFFIINIILIMLHIAHSFLKIFEYLFFFSPKNIIKRSNLYELRELFNFFLKIFHLEFFREKRLF